MRRSAGTSEAIRGAYAGTLDALARVIAMTPKRSQLTWEDAMLILVCWIIVLWLILAG
jgi:hypothetical protein